MAARFTTEYCVKLALGILVKWDVSHGIFDMGLSRDVTYGTPSGMNEVNIRRFRPSRHNRKAKMQN